MNTTTKNNTIKLLMNKTEDAYSRERYGNQLWRTSIKYLLKYYNTKQVEWILRSKHMRWAADAYENNKGINKQTIQLWHKEGKLTLDGYENGN